MDNWTRAVIATTSAGVEPVSASLLALGINGFQVEDANDLEDFLARKAGYWDYYDEELLKLRDRECAVIVYIAGNTQGAEVLAALRQELIRLKALDAADEWGRLALSLSDVREEDWATAWKQYYHALKIGERLVVCPSWEEYAAAPGEIVVRLDPGMAFGTGTHETTRLCMRLLEKHLPSNAHVLDFGCGSGILAISAALLGAETAQGLDIDEVAVRVAHENAALNRVADTCAFRRGTLAAFDGGPYDLIFANIVADVIIENLPILSKKLKPGGILIASGVIDDREQDVLDALARTGFVIRERAAEGGWVGVVASRA